MSSFAELESGGKGERQEKSEQSEKKSFKNTPEFMDFMRKKLNPDLIKRGLGGEGLVGKETWITKTHYPCTPSHKEYQIEKAVLIIRNPFDAVFSLFNFFFTQSQNSTLKQEEFDKLTTFWNEFVLSVPDIYKDFHEFWLKQEIPIYLMRYEDIMENPKEELTKLCKFLYEFDDLGQKMLEEKVAIMTRAFDSPEDSAG